MRQTSQGREKFRRNLSLTESLSLRRLELARDTMFRAGFVIIVVMRNFFQNLLNYVLTPEGFLALVAILVAVPSILLVSKKYSLKQKGGKGSINIQGINIKNNGSIKNETSRR